MAPRRPEHAPGSSVPCRSTGCSAARTQRGEGPSSETPGNKEQSHTSPAQISQSLASGGSVSAQWGIWGQMKE